MTNWFSNFFSVAESDIIAIWGKAVSAGKVVEADVTKVLAWVEQETPALTATVTQITGVLAVVAPTLPAPEAAAVEVSIAGLNAAMIGLNNVATQVQGVTSATSTAQAVVSGVQAVQAVRQAVANVTAAVKVPAAKAA